MRKAAENMYYPRNPLSRRCLFYGVEGVPQDFISLQFTGLAAALPSSHTPPFR